MGRLYIHEKLGAELIREGLTVNFNIERRFKFE